MCSSRENKEIPPFATKKRSVILKLKETSNIKLIYLHVCDEDMTVNRISVLIYFIIFERLKKKQNLVTIKKKTKVRKLV